MNENPKPESAPATADAVNHCRDCCCAKAWEALGVTEYTGMSIVEHIAALRAALAAAQQKPQPDNCACETMRSALLKLEEIFRTDDPHEHRSVTYIITEALAAQPQPNKEAVSDLLSVIALQRAALQWLDENHRDTLSELDWNAVDYLTDKWTHTTDQAQQPEAEERE